MNRVNDLYKYMTLDDYFMMCLDDYFMMCFLHFFNSTQVLLKMNSASLLR